MSTNQTFDQKDFLNFFQITARDATFKDDIINSIKKWPLAQYMDIAGKEKFPDLCYYGYCEYLYENVKRETKATCKN